MITAVHRTRLLTIIVMLFSLAGMSLSAIGEASSHGIAELTGAPDTDHGDHTHSRGEDERPDSHLHHDSGNHTHESADQFAINLMSEQDTSFRQAIPFAGESPRSVRYRLDRPPKTSPIS